MTTQDRLGLVVIFICVLLPFQYARKKEKRESKRKEEEINKLNNAAEAMNWGKQKLGTGWPQITAYLRSERAHTHMHE